MRRSSSVRCRRRTPPPAQSRCIGRRWCSCHTRSPCRSGRRACRRPPTGSGSDIPHHRVGYRTPHSSSLHSGRWDRVPPSGSGVRADTSDTGAACACLPWRPPASPLRAGAPMRQAPTPRAPAAATQPCHSAATTDPTLGRPCVSPPSCHNCSRPRELPVLSGFDDLALLASINEVITVQLIVDVSGDHCAFRHALTPRKGLESPRSVPHSRLQRKWRSLPRS
jgi:hypothetical protein